MAYGDDNDYSRFGKYAYSVYWGINRAQWPMANGYYRTRKEAEERAKLERRRTGHKYAVKKVEHRATNLRPRGRKHGRRGNPEDPYYWRKEGGLWVLRQKRFKHLLDRGKREHPHDIMAYARTPEEKKSMYRTITGRDQEENPRPYTLRTVAPLLKRNPNRLTDVLVKRGGKVFKAKAKYDGKLGRVRIFANPRVARAINPESLQLRIEQAFEVGEKTGIARKQRDEARAKFHKDWFSRFKSLQPTEDKNQIQQAFDNGYRAGYGDVPVRYFK